MSNLTVHAAPGRKVPYEAQLGANILPTTAVTVPPTHYYLKAIDDGDLLLGAPASYGGPGDGTPDVV